MSFEIAWQGEIFSLGTRGRPGSALRTGSQPDPSRGTRGDLISEPSSLMKSRRAASATQGIIVCLPGARRMPTLAFG